MTSGDAADWRRVPIVIGCDTDPDRESLVGPLPADRLSWRGMREGIPALKARVADLRDDDGHTPRFTWLLRADEQVAQLEGRYDWSLAANRAFFEELVAGGDALGWHPHFWRRDAATGRWYQEVEDAAWQLAMLREAHAALVGAGLRPASVRMGWTYHTPATFAELDALGVRLEFSPFPGLRSYRDRPRRRDENQFDWYATPTHSYHAAPHDQRVPARSGEPALRMLTLPCWVSTDAFWGLAAGAQMARKSRVPGLLWDAMRRRSYVINLTARPKLFQPLVNGLRKSLRWARAGLGPAPAFATYFHPDELIPNRSAMYALDHVRENLAAVLDCIRSEGAAPTFVTADHYVDHWGAALRATA